MSQVFVSYAREDEKAAHALVAFLENQGFSVFWDRKIGAGKSFDEVIELALQEAGAVIVLWSAASVSSDWVRAEAEAAAARRILVPAIIESTQIPLRFNRIQAANLLDWDLRSRVEGLEEILKSITALLGEKLPGSSPSHSFAEHAQEGLGAPLLSEETPTEREGSGIKTKEKYQGLSRTIFVGLGGTGAEVLMHLRRLIVERFVALDNMEGVSFLSIDTDVRSQRPSADGRRKTPLDDVIGFSRYERVNIKVDLKNYLDPDSIYRQQIHEWWDESLLCGQEFNLERGAGQVRQLGRLAFFGSRSEIQEGLERAYQKVTAHYAQGKLAGASSKIRIVVVAGLGGGTGSGILFDFAALLKAQIGQHEILSLDAFLVLPGAFSTVEQGNNYSKIAANGYAALKELNHYLVHPFRTWMAKPTSIEVYGLYERYVLFSGVNASNEYLADLADSYRAIGEILFLDFGGGPMAEWIQSMRVNRQQYLNGVVINSYTLARLEGGSLGTHSDQWKTAFSSAGLSKLVFPSWRWINRAKYELAAQMAALMDPGRFSKVVDILVAYRDRFLFECGFLQGAVQTEQGRQAHWQVRDRLAKQVDAGPEIDNVYEHIHKYQNELIEFSKQMYAEKSTVELGDKVWKRLATLWGDPFSPGSAGDWPKQIRENCRAFAKEIHERLPTIIEDFRRKPAVGLSGVMAILVEVLELLDRPAEQAQYSDWFRQQRQALKRSMDENQDLWSKELRNAHRTSVGFGSNRKGHRAATQRAAEALGKYWCTRVNDYICDQAPELFCAIRTSLIEQLSRLERISETMLSLEAEYQSFARFYDASQRSFIIRELAPPANLGDLLDPFLGRHPEERSLRLQRLLDKSLRQMNLDTLEQLEKGLANDYERLRDDLANRMFYALRGEGGTTTAFSENSGEAIPGFIERYSVFRILKENFSEIERRELFAMLYRRGLPWAQKSRSDAIVTDYRAHGDAFLGCIEDDFQDVAREMLQCMQSQAEFPFLPRLVCASDPSEIIFYTELTAFPTYYLSELTELNRCYDSLLSSTRTITSLHIDQDYLQFQPLIPFNQAQLASNKHAWQLFIQAQMLGLIRSLRPGANDVRILYQWRRKAGAFHSQWIDLDSEESVIERLMRTPDLRNRLQGEIMSEKERFLAMPSGSLYYLIALADYYTFCIFPERRASESRHGLTAPLISMQNLVCNELRTDWRNEQKSIEPDAIEVEENIRQVVLELSSWSRPIYRNPRQPVPSTEEVPELERLEEWELADNAAEAVRTLMAQGRLPQIRDQLGDPIMHFPRLAVDWEYFDAARSGSKMQGGL